MVSGFPVRQLLLISLALAAGATAGANAAEKPVPLFLTLPKPKVLYVADTPNREEWAETLRHKMPAEVLFAPLSYSDLDCHHLCDKPLEESRADVDSVSAAGQAHLSAVLGAMTNYDVIIAQFPSLSGDTNVNQRLVDVEKRLVARLQKGGNLIFINSSWETTFENTPLAGILPVKFDGRKTWTTRCQGATDHPLARGIPLEITASHWYGPVYAPADDTCTPLTRNKDAAQFWLRRLPGGGTVVHLFSAYGGLWQWNGPNYAVYAAERPDDGAAWDAFFRRLLYGLTYGDKAFPVLVSFPATNAVPCRYGSDLDVPVDVDNRADKGQEVSVVLEVSHRRSERTITRTQKLSLSKGERRTIAFTCRIDLPCTDPYLVVKASVLDASGNYILSESTTWIPYTHGVPLTVKTDRPSYAPGQEIKAAVNWTNAATAGSFAGHLFVVDRAGRILRHVTSAVAITTNVASTWSCSATMPDGGPGQASCYWITALISDGKTILGTARSQVQLDQPWTMRDQFQWSLWTWGGDARRMTLFQDAGFNALGMGGSCPTADRFGLRQYVEGTGINTFGVTIDYDNWKDVQAAMEKTMAAAEKEGPDARSKSLVSLGEESGFQGGWGTRYYWPEDKAPPLVQKVFDDYLSETYVGNIGTLNDEWGTQYKGFAEIPLEKAKVTAPSQVFMGAQAWEAMQTKGEGKGRLPIDTKKVDPNQRYMANSAPYIETFGFFDWYYQKYCDLATQAYRGLRNPTPLTIMSAPGGFYPKVDVYNFAGQGPFYPKETALVGNAVARRDYGDVPGFSGAMWAYFDLHALWESTVLSSILVGNTHIDYWVDIPLTFNADLTHTRASFWTKDLTRRLRPIEPILLHKRIAYTPGLGMLIPPQPLAKGVTGQHFGSAISCNAPVYSALEESGYMPRVVTAKDLKSIQVLVASYAQVLNADEGRQIAEFVRGGGLLIATPWLASCSPHGNALTVYPSPESGLADLLGFRLLNTSQEPAVEDVKADLGAMFNGAGELTLTSKGKDAVQDMARDVAVAGKHKDGSPLVLVRAAGKGKIVYLNFVYDWNGWWNSFHEPPREAYRKLFDAIIRSDGRVKADCFLSFESAEVTTDNNGWWGMTMNSKPGTGESIPWWSSQLYSDPSGAILYLGVFADHRSPTITAKLTRPASNVRIFDLLNGTEVRSEGNGPALTLRPGGAAFWALSPLAPSAIKLDLESSGKAGASVHGNVRLPGTDKSDCVFGVTVDVYDPSGTRSVFHSPANVSLSNGQAQFEIPVAENDPPGKYRVIATESMTRLTAEKSFTVKKAPDAIDAGTLTPFPRRAGEDWPVTPMSDGEFLHELRLLRDVYLGSYQGLTAKYRLSYYLNVPFQPDSRHAIMRCLQRTDWKPHLKAVTDALRDGEMFYLTGEDLNTDPATGLRIDPLAVADPGTFLSQIARKGKERTLKSEEGLTFRIIEIGKGALVICTDSLDSAVYLSKDFTAWHEQFRKSLQQIRH